VIPEHELSLLNFEPMIAGGGKMAVAGENAVEFLPSDNSVTRKDSNTRRFPVHFPSKNLLQKVKIGFFR
jgi:hypothetical protein